MAAAELMKSEKMFNGWVKRFKHSSAELGCDMLFTVFFPPAAAAEGVKVPVVYYLSGLTCTDENFTLKAGAQRTAAELGLALVAPDTSPRGLNIEGEEDSWDFGTGAGFYLDAKEPKWARYRMYSYITKELPAVLAATAPQLDLGNACIMGHSMGGHGALTIALKNPAAFKSVSVFAPICNPTQVPWGHKAFSGYLGEGWQAEAAEQYDATEMVKKYSGPRLPVLMDNGTADDYLQTQLHPWAFEGAAQGKLDLTSRMQDGYNHGYFFISTFMEDHLAFHAKHLLA
ncbi:S-formylglutathione hydrolase [Micractinium conductrix]|uniref:S-formylglutathione hydrolase n=1 Tax=Micractinium conductrix TaxID=554055 RepID=A0A2P6VAR0_9CHLO|nr:S-formylglutathione hydrolase [Micractinium conductrix]|eukprot:PSC71177.1 S-formylglutathione hydrolase [Micractinium conductrix]